ncbi:hypothetical protein GCM10028818_54740 [Spirosoma horti]
MRTSWLKRENLYVDVALLTFKLDYDATIKADSSHVQIKVRETLKWHKINNHCKLVQNHFSGMPVNGAKHGFKSITLIGF